MPRFHWRVAPIGAFLLLLSVRTTRADGNDFREDVLRCEDAVAYLASCCPGFDAHRLRCDYLQQGSDGTCGAPYHEERPAFSIADSECVVATSCSALVADGVCARAQAQTSLDTGCDPAADPEPPECFEPQKRVCP